MLKDALDLWKELRRRGNSGTSLRMRLLVFFLVFLLAVVSGFLLIFSLTGVFSNKLDEYHDWTKSELNRLSQNTYNDFGKLSLEGLSLSESLSKSLEKDMQEQGFLPNQLAKNSDSLELLLDHQIDSLIAAHKQVQASGVFLILDATVNPNKPDAAKSKAGIYLKSTEPNIINATDLYIRYLRGPSAIAINHDIPLVPQWKMEFDTTKDDFFQTTIQTAKESALPLSRLYYWSERVLLEDNCESTMLLCVPLISSDHTVFGVCGFEVSSMLFKLAYSPSNTSYHRVFATLTPSKDNLISPNHGLIAGNYYMTSHSLGEKMILEKGKKGFTLYKTENADTYIGLSTPLSLYPQNSAYSNQKWVLSIMLPHEELLGLVSAENKKILFAFFILCIISFFVADLISKRYIRPVLTALNNIKTDSYAAVPKTNILEIDDLLEFLAAEDAKFERRITEVKSKAVGNAFPDKEQTGFSAYSEFVSNISTLSPAEKAVFDLYMKGHSANEIAEILYLSINTIKTHNRRIYTKLNVSSRKELMVYVNMMKELEGTITS